MRIRLLLISIIIAGLMVSALSIIVYRGWQSRKPKPQPVVEKIPDTKITIIEGWTTEDIANDLSGTVKHKQIVTKEEFLGAVGSFDTSSYGAIDRPNTNSLEGYLFPDTYLVGHNATSIEIIDTLLTNFQKKWIQASSGIPKAGNRYVIPGYEAVKIRNTTGLSQHQILTLASIVERETGRNIDPRNAQAVAQLQEERKTVAGIFYNRLLAGIPLQSDATVNYITKKNDPAASAADIEIDDPYNTYKYAGLPPGPIGNPSLSSIEAALLPAETDYYYFLHKQPSGEVVYSKTFEEHVQNKNRYLR